MAMLSNAVDGFQLAYDRIGEGPAVVLLHGWPGDRTDYRVLAPMLAERGFEVVVPDLRGFGESDRSVRWIRRSTAWPRRGGAWSG